jgi:hypothetical protein
VPNKKYTTNYRTHGKELNSGSDFNTNDNLDAFLVTVPMGAQITDVASLGSVYTRRS